MTSKALHAETGLDPSDDVIAYTILEAARKARISRAFLYKQIADGRLPARKLGSRTIILRADLVAYLEGSPRFSSSSSTET